MNRVIHKRFLIFFPLGCFISVLSQTHQSALAQPIAPQTTINSVSTGHNLSFERHFRELGVEGSILIVDGNSDHIYQYNPQRNRTPFLPASTFKILNSLIALETGVIPDERAVLPWDGVQRQVPEWNHNLNMKEAFNLSAIWFYQILARRIGYTRMQQWLIQANYGNKTIGPKEDIDKFWVEGNLRITPGQQIQFLRRLYKNELPFSVRSLSIVKDLMVVAKTSDYTLRGKTGWVGFGSRVTPKIGWYVGYLEKGKNVYFFATNLNIRSKKDPPARIEVTQRCFKDLALP